VQKWSLPLFQLRDTRVVYHGQNEHAESQLELKRWRAQSKFVIWSEEPSMTMISRFELHQRANSGLYRLHPLYEAIPKLGEISPCILQKLRRA